MLSEQKLSNKIRIQMIEEIAWIDLPGFLFLEIDAALSILNYYKLSNLQRNEQIFLSYLDEVSREYNNMMLTHAKQQTTTLKNNVNKYAGFLTDFLIMKSVKLNFSAQELIGIESLYRVRVLLKMKEFINRRIYNERSISWLNKKIKKTSGKAKTTKKSTTTRKKKWPDSSENS